MPTGHGSREPWARREEAVIAEFYHRGVELVAERLPNRTVQAIRQRAKKIGLAKASPQGLRHPLADNDSSAALDRHDQGMSFEAIARTLNADCQAVTNSIMLALCIRAGNTPAKRDAAGGLVATEVVRIQQFIAAGMTGPEIQVQMGISASCVSHHRRRMKLAGLCPPPPGGGRRYSGSRIQEDVRLEIDRLLLEGYGTAKVAELVDVSTNVVKRARNVLIEKLRRRGECLAGCDANGRRIKVKESKAFISEQDRVDLELLLLARVPVKTAARQVGMGVASASRIRDDLRIRLAEEGKDLPSPKLPGRPAPAAPIARNTIWHRVDGTKPPKRVRRSPAPIATKSETHTPIDPQPLAASAPAKPLRQAPRRLTFEEQLARVAAGAGIHTKFRPPAPALAMTLGGVGSSLL